MEVERLLGNLWMIKHMMELQNDEENMDTIEDGSHAGEQDY